MSEENKKPTDPLALCSQDQWAEPVEMEHWREEVVRRIEKRKSEGVTKGRSLEFIDPEKAARALFLISTGNYAKYRIAKELGVSKFLVDRLEYNHSDSLETRRKELSVRFTILAEKMAVLMDRKVEDLLEDPDALKDIPFKDISIAMGVMTDKSAQMAGIATTVIEHRSGPKLEDFEAMKSAARQRLVEQGKVIEVETLINEVAQA